MKRWLDRPLHRLILVALIVWLVLLALSLVVSALVGDFTGPVIITGVMAMIVLMGYLVPRVSNWVEYRIWTGEINPKPRQHTDGPTEGENE